MGPDPETWSTSAPLPWPSVEYAAREGRAVRGGVREAPGAAGRRRVITLPSRTGPGDEVRG